VHWQVEVVGDPADLNTLADGFADQSLQIRQAPDGKFILTAGAVSDLSDPWDVLKQARLLLDQVAGSARLFLGMTASLTVGNVTRLRDDGRKDYFILPEPARFTARAFAPTIVVAHADGSQDISRPSDPVWRALQTARKDPTVAKLLRLRNRANLAWVELYRIFEIIQASVGRSHIVSSGWATDTDLTRFTHSANSVTVGGDDARHGIERSDPPARPLDLEQAQSLVDSWIKSYLHERAS
jgi:hypothetical protein